MRGLTDTLTKAAEHEHLVFLCSFQKEESVILDELLALAPHTRVVTIDTGVLFPETLQTWKKFEDQVRKLAMPAEFGLETMNEFIDWNRNVPFQVIRGEGECAV